MILAKKQKAVFTFETINIYRRQKDRQVEYYKESMKVK
jgi:hypothetical protein